MSLAAWIAPARTALLVVDMQVDFAAPHGAAARWGLDLSTVGPAVRVAEGLVAAARRVGAMVVFAGLSTTPQTDSEVWRERLRRRGDDAEAAFCRAGDPGEAFYGPQPGPGDLVVRKTRYSAFWGTGLAETLRARGIDTLVVAGVTTECCVDSTARDAFNHDFHVVIATDACAAYEPDLHVAALRMLDLNTAVLADTASIVAAWTP